MSIGRAIREGIKLTKKLTNKGVRKAKDTIGKEKFMSNAELKELEIKEAGERVLDENARMEAQARKRAREKKYLDPTWQARVMKDSPETIEVNNLWFHSLPTPQSPKEIEEFSRDFQNLINPKLMLEDIERIHLTPEFEDKSIGFITNEIMQRTDTYVSNQLMQSWKPLRAESKRLNKDFNPNQLEEFGLFTLKRGNLSLTQLENVSEAAKIHRDMAQTGKVAKPSPTTHGSTQQNRSNIKDAIWATKEVLKDMLPKAQSKDDLRGVYEMLMKINTIISSNTRFGIPLNNQKLSADFISAMHDGYPSERLLPYLKNNPALEKVFDEVISNQGLDLDNIKAPIVGSLISMHAIAESGVAFLHNAVANWVYSQPMFSRPMASVARMLGDRASEGLKYPSPATSFFRHTAAVWHEYKHFKEELKRQAEQINLTTTMRYEGGSHNLETARKIMQSNPNHPLLSYFNKVSGATFGTMTLTLELLKLMDKEIFPFSIASMNAANSIKYKEVMKRWLSGKDTSLSKEALEHIAINERLKQMINSPEYAPLEDVIFNMNYLKDQAEKASEKIIQAGEEGWRKKSEDLRRLSVTIDKIKDDIESGAQLQAVSDTYRDATEKSLPVVDDFYNALRNHLGRPNNRAMQWISGAFPFVSFYAASTKQLLQMIPGTAAVKVVTGNKMTNRDYTNGMLGATLIGLLWYHTQKEGEGQLVYYEKNANGYDKGWHSKRADNAYESTYLTEIFNSMLPNPVMSEFFRLTARAAEVAKHPLGGWDFSMTKIAHINGFINLVDTLFLQFINRNAGNLFQNRESAVETGIRVMAGSGGMLINSIGGLGNPAILARFVGRNALDLQSESFTEAFTKGAEMAARLFDIEFLSGLNRHYSIGVEDGTTLMETLQIPVDSRNGMTMLQAHEMARDDDFYFSRPIADVIRVSNGDITSAMGLKDVGDYLLVDFGRNWKIQKGVAVIKNRIAYDVKNLTLQKFLGSRIYQQLKDYSVPMQLGVAFEVFAGGVIGKSQSPGFAYGQTLKAYADNKKLERSEQEELKQAVYNDKIKSDLIALTALYFLGKAKGEEKDKLKEAHPGIAEFIGNNDIAASIENEIREEARVKNNATYD